ncbi:NADH-ubiquinone oxidoreductase-F iron-sulfur binding region domain-containing protein [Streptomyces sp. NBC_00648]|uniref:NADH-ubiquinone oxidoreductase-F iron-sulfur binding region domain-containing protein n=1 Tax=Streptomyces sp. NBC_00648 TaxID=2975797 RepID=UPI002F90DFE5
MSLVQPDIMSFGPPTLLAGLEKAERMDRDQHLDVHGPLRLLRTDDLVELATSIDLRGRGGAGFPFARKLQAVMKSAAAGTDKPAVIVNGSEGEPSCLKDTALLLRAPHLVIDGAELAAAAIGADQVVLGVTRPDVEKALVDALAERGPSTIDIAAQRLPERFVTGESTAMTNGLNNGQALPTGRKVRTSERGLDGVPTLFSNTETFAQLAVASRLGAAGYRRTGLAEEPGTVLLTMSGSLVVECPTGVPLNYVLEMCGMAAGQGVLVGGYHGLWLDPMAAQQALVSRESMKSLGATLGAGAVLPLPEDTCPVGEVARVARWMADESAQQCGPCVWGLARLADELAALAGGGGLAAYDAVFTHIKGVMGRGACSHPDGTSKFVASALSIFGDDVARHVQSDGCGRPVLGVLPLTNEEAAKNQSLVVDWTLCRGHGLCADVLPEVVQLGPDSYPVSPRMSLGAEYREDALKAVRRCPALALRIEA